MELSQVSNKPLFFEFFFFQSPQQESVDNLKVGEEKKASEEREREKSTAESAM